jgi:hypothetical protein
MIATKGDFFRRDRMSPLSMSNPTIPTANMVRSILSHEGIPVSMRTQQIHPPANTISPMAKLNILAVLNIKTTPEAIRLYVPPISKPMAR